MSSEQSEQVKIAVVENELKNVTVSIKALGLQIEKMSISLENLRTSFPTRDEFNQLSVIVRGVSNDGGLVKKVDKLERKLIYYLGAGAVIGVLILGGWQLFLIYAGNRIGNTTTINTSSK